MKKKPAEILKNLISFWRRLGKDLKIILGSILLAFFTSFFLSQWSLRSLLKNVLDRQNSQIDHLNRLGEELEKELKFYKEARITGEGKLFQQLSGLKEELAKYKSQNQVLGEKDIQNKVNEAVAVLEEWLAGKEIATPAGELLRGMVKINDSKWENLEVYAEPRASAKIIGKAKYGEIYFYTQKENNWYKIEFNEGKYGWAQAQFLEELP